MMTLREIIDTLEELAKEYGEDTSVRLAHRAQYPLEYYVGEIVATGMEMEGEAEVVIYIGEGATLGYLPSVASLELGWG